MKISRLGEAPDYRFSLANVAHLSGVDSHLLLGFLAAGVGLDQLAPDFATPVIRELRTALLLCLLRAARRFMAIYAGYVMKKRAPEEKFALCRLAC